MHTIVLLTIIILCSISTCGVHTIVDKFNHLQKKIILIKNMIRQKNLERKFEFPDRYRNQRKKEREKLRLSRARLRLPTILYCASKVKFLDVCVCVCVCILYFLSFFQVFWLGDLLASGSSFATPFRLSNKDFWARLSSGLKITFDRRRSLMEDDLQQKTTFDGRQTLMEDDHRSKTTFDRRQP